jgi:hypothetical protein
MPKETVAIFASNNQRTHDNVAIIGDRQIPTVFTDKAKTNKRLNVNNTK